MPKLVTTSTIAERRQANKAEMAEWFNVSVATVDAWLRRGCPYIQRGGPGKGWVFDLREVAQWYYGKSAQADETEDDPEQMSPKERLDWYRGETERMKIASRRQELYERAPTLHAFSTTIAVFAEQVRAIPDILERRAGLNPKQAELTADEIDTQLETVKKRLLDQIQSGQTEDAA